MFQQCFSRKLKNLCKLFIYNYLQRFLSTQTRGRTGMEVNPLVFETSASTDSAIWASAFQMRCKDTAFFYICNSFGRKNGKEQNFFMEFS